MSDIPAEPPPIAKIWQLANTSEPSPASTRITRASDYSYSDDSSAMRWAQFNLIQSAFPQAAIMAAVFRHGTLLLGNTTLPIDTVMFDTGALSASYVSPSYIAQHSKLLARFLQSTSRTVYFADEKTHVTVEQLLALPIEFKADDGTPYRATLQFNVFDIGHKNAIIGLGDICQYFLPLLVTMLHDGKAIADNNLNNLSSNVKNGGELRAPWSQPVNVPAPEDEATPLPCSFTYALHFMEQSVADSKQEYLDLFETHVHPDFLIHANVRELLLTKGAHVFIPQNWDGIRHVEPIKIEVIGEMPKNIKPKARNVNPALMEHAYAEFKRLLGYFYEPSNSDTASCLVIAPKATKPFIRFCGDYVRINKFIKVGHYPIPNVQHELQKIQKYKVFLDLDWANSFHQFPLHPETSALLSIQTVWGQYQPKFLPEGVAPASFVLQKAVREIFAPYDEWTIAIFDNLLILAHDFDDAYKKLDIILDRCIEYNIYLKFSKTWLGYDHANFFGYVCKHNAYELSVERKASIDAIPFPKDQKQMQRFLGSALFFKSFVPHYSTLSAPLNDMVKKDFQWKDPTVWTVDYHQVFRELKAALMVATKLHYPDYNLTWIVRADASQVGVGAVLLMLRLNDDATEDLIPIAYSSEKFSDQATRWTTIEQEAYALYFALNAFRYLLQAKPFILETDHNNLVWMEQSQVPKVVRWRIFMQSFVFLLRHIPGKKNVIADYLSRLHENDQPIDTFCNMFESDTPVPSDEVPPDKLRYTQEEALHAVHGTSAGHFGARTTWNTLCKHFPNHGIPYKEVEDFVASCPVCQKVRLGRKDALQPIIRHLKGPAYLDAVGVDLLTITPPDDAGHKYLCVLVRYYTKHAFAYPMPNKEAVTVAKALFQYFCTFGICNLLQSDPGSEFTNIVLKQLNDWFGIHHRFSLVDRPQSNGVEGTNKQIVRHLQALVLDKRVGKQWSDPVNLSLVLYIINSHKSSETGLVPLQATFGDQSAIFFNFPHELPSNQQPHEYIRKLNDNLTLLRKISDEFQAKIIAKRTAPTPAALQNSYQPGDFVLFDIDPKVALPTKLTPRYKGPFQVLKQVKNDVTCRHVVQGQVYHFHVDRLKLFYGDQQAAYDLALSDANQYVIDRILAYRGEPHLRTSLDFKVRFADSDVLWLPYSLDLAASLPFEDFCRSKPELCQALLTTRDAAKRKTSINTTAIAIDLNTMAYVDLRFFGSAWYHALDLPDADHLRYVLPCIYSGWATSNRRRIHISSAFYQLRWTVDNFFIHTYGSCSIFDSSTSMVLVNDALATVYPGLRSTAWPKLAPVNAYISQPLR